ncbi:transposase [Nonomuraea sp. NPDC050153]|uniref:transposase n=1 Tax=Nonomuraea sp. NPDC050153 TaxID=3364359 RepID=UPI0037B545F1
MEDDVKDAKTFGLKTLPFYRFAANQAWCTAVALAADLLAHLRLLTLDHHEQLRKATPGRIRQALLHVPARLVRRARKRLLRLPDDHPHTGDLILAWTRVRQLSHSLSPP